MPDPERSLDVPPADAQGLVLSSDGLCLSAAAKARVVHFMIFRSLVQDEEWFKNC